MGIAPSNENYIEHLLALSEGLYELKAQFVHDRKSAEFLEIYEKPAPLVSVCVATANRPKLLVERCIASLLRQTYSNLQIVVVGDHCVDETEYELSKVKDSRVQFENLPERGPYPPFGQDRWFVAGSRPMNRALELSEGEFIAHLDDDDESVPDRIEKLVRLALEKRAEFLWHKLLMETASGIWQTRGGPDLVIGQVSTGSIFYHRYFRKIPWDVHAYRLSEPGDWNRIRKIKFLGPRLAFLDEPLLIHYREQATLAPFELQPNETTLDW